MRLSKQSRYKSRWRILFRCRGGAEVSCIAAGSELQVLMCR